MCNNMFGDNSCTWIILLIILFCCCGGSHDNGCSRDCGCCG
ncbi:MAG: hypothetical protein PUC88_07180 [Clostridia bacterium]|nr:hypothetical protein [Clostridia bacterium]